MSEKAAAFSITDSNIAIGDIGSQFVHEDPFAGCISEVQVWSYEKSAEQIAQQSLPEVRGRLLTLSIENM